MYSYEREKPELFTDRGQRLFLAIRDNMRSLLKKAGAVRMEDAITGNSGSTWEMLACVDRMVELGELFEVTAGQDVAGQHRVFIARGSWV